MGRKLKHEQMWDMMSVAGRMQLLRQMAQVHPAVDFSRQYAIEQLARTESEELPATLHGTLLVAATPDGFSMSQLRENVNLTSVFT
jgi:hypothetical protein